MGSGMVLGTCLGGVHGHKVGTGFGMDKLQQWGAGGGCEGGSGCGFVTKWTHGCHRVPQVNPLTSDLPIFCACWCLLLSIVNLSSLGVHCAVIFSQGDFLPDAVRTEKRTAMAVSHLMVRWNGTASFYARRISESL